MSIDETPENPTPDAEETTAAAASDAAQPTAPPATTRLVKIKFRAAGRHYDFGALNLTLSKGDKVVVETDRGRALGTVVALPREVDNKQLPEGLKNVLRHAMADDLAMAATFNAKEENALRFCRARIAERKMEMKLVRAEYLFDGSKIIFYFTADGRIDFRELVKDLAHHFHTRIEMRQIGVRDEAKLTGGIGVCGRELCCSSYLTEFAPVSVKMAKEQDLALNPNKISGQCGRLLCCLAYEYETYCELKKGLPKCGRKVTVEGREGEVISQHVLRQTVTVNFGPQQRVEMTAEEVEKGVMPQRQLPASSPPAERSGSPAGRPAERQQRDGAQQQQQQQRNRPGGQQPGGQRKPQPPPVQGQQQQRPAPGQQRPAPAADAKAPHKAAPPPGKGAEAQAQGAKEKSEQEQRRRRQRNRRRPNRKPGSTPQNESGA